MNLFRSEEHVKNWSGFQKGTADGILTLNELMAIFSTPRHTEKMSKNYVSSMAGYKKLFIEKVDEIKGNSSIWKV